MVLMYLVRLLTGQGETLVRVLIHDGICVQQAQAFLNQENNVTSLVHVQMSCKQKML